MFGVKGTQIERVMLHKMWWKINRFQATTANYKKGCSRLHRPFCNTEQTGVQSSPEHLELRVPSFARNCSLLEMKEF